MQLVSGIKMRKSQAAELEGRPYRDGLNNIMAKIATRVEPQHSLLLSRTNEEGEKKLLILISSNKGLAGSFNVNLARFLLKSEIDFYKTEFVTVGSKGAHFVSKMGGNVLADFSRGKPLTEVSAIFNFVFDKFFQSSIYQTITVVYNRFISTLKSEPTEDLLLPLSLLREKLFTEQKQTGIYLIEPSPEKIIDQLLRSYVEDKIRGAIISSEAVEHSMRMMAMKNATDNAADVIYNLTLVGNQLRQEKITYELLDMVTSKESVEN